MHILDTMFSALAIYYKRRRYALLEIQIMKMNLNLQSVECKKQDLDYGYIVLQK